MAKQVNFIQAYKNRVLYQLRTNSTKLLLKLKNMPRERFSNITNNQHLKNQSKYQSSLQFQNLQLLQNQECLNLKTVLLIQNRSKVRSQRQRTELH